MSTLHGSASRAGRRPNNEDSALAVSESGLFAVSDGMGGLEAGEVASALAVETLRAAASEIAALRAGIAGDPSPEAKLALADKVEALAQSANEAIWEQARTRRSRMGATLSAVVVAGQAAFVAHTGDSRAYLVRDDEVYLLTTDTTVAAMRLRAGRITPDQYERSPYRNALYEALGLAPTVQIEFQEVGLNDGDVLVLCSDGVWEYLPGGALVRAAAMDPEEAAHRLVEQAFEGGSDDNITAVVVRYRDDRQRSDPAVMLRKIPLFSALDPPELRRLAPFLRERRFAPGEVIIQEGEEGHELLVLVEGQVVVSRRGVTLTRLEPPQSFGEIALDRACPRMATVTAVQQVRVLAMHRDQLNDLILRQPALGAHVVVHLMRQLADWLVELTDKVTAQEAAEAREAANRRS
jgi:serine/threonine protein phosphatase PrpC